MSKHGVHGPSGKTKKKAADKMTVLAAVSVASLSLEVQARAESWADPVDHKDRPGLPTRNSKARMTPPVATTFSKVSIRIPPI